MKKTSREVETAWVVWNLIDDVSRLLWILYEEEFVEMIEKGENTRSLLLLLAKRKERQRNF
jgi:hypothetical protein